VTAYYCVRTHGVFHRDWRGGRPAGGVTFLANESTLSHSVLLPPLSLFETRTGTLRRWNTNWYYVVDRVLTTRLVQWLSGVFATQERKKERNRKGKQESRRRWGKVLGIERERVCVWERERERERVMSRTLSLPLPHSYPFPLPPSLPPSPPLYSLPPSIAISLSVSLPPFDVSTYLSPSTCLYIYW